MKSSWHSTKSTSLCRFIPGIPTSVPDRPGHTLHEYPHARRPDRARRATGKPSSAPCGSGRWNTRAAPRCAALATCCALRPNPRPRPPDPSPFLGEWRGGGACPTPGRAPAHLEKFRMCVPRAVKPRTVKWEDLPFRGLLRVTGTTCRTDALTRTTRGSLQRVGRHPARPCHLPHGAETQCPRVEEALPGGHSTACPARAAPSTGRPRCRLWQRRAVHVRGARGRCQGRPKQYAPAASIWALAGILSTV